LKLGDLNFTLPFSRGTNGISPLEGHGLPELVTKVPHIAFQVDNLDAKIVGCKVLFGPYSPIVGYRVAMIEEQGVSIELVETKLTDVELALLEREKLGKSY
jgi:hypothetical protein